MRAASLTTTFWLVLGLLWTGQIQGQVEGQAQGQVQDQAPVRVQGQTQGEIQLQPLSEGEEAAPQPPAKPLTPEQQVTGAEAIVTRGAALSKRVRHMLNDARKANDIIQVTCLNDKLTQINANLRNAQNRLEELKKAVDPDRRSHEYTVITVIGQKLEVLDQEAGQCVGEDLFDTGDTSVTTEINEALVPMDETPSSPPVVLPPSLPTIPPPSSPTM